MSVQDEDSSSNTPFGWNDIANAMWGGRWVFLPLLATVMAAVVFLTPAEDAYRTEAKLVLAVSASIDEPYQVIDALSILDARTMQSTLSELAESTPMREIALAGFPAADPEDIVIGTAVAQEANIIDFSVEGPDEEVVVPVLSSLLEASSSRFLELYPVFAAEIVSPPSSPELVPSTLLPNVVIGGVAAVLLWLSLSVGWDRWSQVRRNHRAGAGK